MQRGSATGRLVALATALVVVVAAFGLAGLADGDAIPRALARTVPGVVEPVVPRPWVLDAYTGLGAWVDVYDWSEAFTDGQPTVGPPQVDAMAAAGVQTLYVQLGHDKAAADRLEPARLQALVDRAHDRRMTVVGWYLPTLVDPAKDLRRILVSQDLDLDGLAVDIESRAVADVATRNERLLALTVQVRAAIGARVLGAITPSAVHLQVVNTDFWPAFPWQQVATAYDVVLPMAYWSIRRGELRSGERYIGENIDRIRASTGQPDLPIHPIGGIADDTTLPDLAGMVRAIRERGAIGGSLYDWRTSTPDEWVALAPLTHLRA